MGIAELGTCEGLKILVEIRLIVGSNPTAHTIFRLTYLFIPWLGKQIQVFNLDGFDSLMSTCFLRLVSTGEISWNGVYKMTGFESLPPICFWKSDRVWFMMSPR